MRYKNNSGAAMIIVVTISAVLFGMLALSADMGYLFLARNQLQNAADAGALAGAPELTYLYGGITGSEQSARDKAIEYATRHLAADRLVEAADVAVDINSDASVFGVVGYTGPAIRVTVRRTGGTSVALFFGRILGKPEAGVMATAVARLVPLQATCGFVPWLIRNWPFSDTINIGDEAILKYNAQGVGREEPGWFSPAQFPPVTKPECGSPQPGGNVYSNNIISGSSCDCPFGIGDILKIETGNLVGPTVGTGGLPGVEDLIAMDPAATYDSNTKTVTGSSHTDWTQSERIVNVLLFSNGLTLEPSTREITVEAIGSFFISSVTETGTGNDKQANVTGFFVGITTGGGIPGDPGTSSFIFTAQLIR